jgi:hypothetical protein
MLFNLFQIVKYCFVNLFENCIYVNVVYTTFKIVIYLLQIVCGIYRVSTRFGYPVFGQNRGPKPEPGYLATKNVLGFGQPEPRTRSRLVENWVIIFFFPKFVTKHKNRIILLCILVKQICKFT